MQFKEYPRLKRIWYGMRDRCRRGATYTKKNIKVCEEWQTFDNFERWAYANGYKDPEPGAAVCDALSIDRIDSKGDYSPDNCQWITRRNNSRKRDKILTDFDPREAAEQIIDNCIGFDGCFYSKSEKQKAVSDIEQALSHIKIIAESPRNFDYWRTFADALKYLYN